MNIFAHIVKFVCVCVCVAFLWTRCKMASDRKGIKFDGVYGKVDAKMENSAKMF